MKRRLASACGALALLGMAAPAWAGDGSVYLRCDGNPAAMGAGELAARLLVITASAGLLGGSEVADAGKRLEGEPGVAACSEAIAGEGDDVRRIELTLARAVHDIEAEDYEGALADARSITGIAGDRASDHGYQQSLMLSGLDIEAAALARLGRTGEAEAAGLRMAELSPFDLQNLLRASQYVGLTDAMSPQKKVFLDSFARMWGGGLMQRSLLREWAGDYAGAAADDAALAELISGFVSDEAAPAVSLSARRAVALALAGDLAGSGKLAAETRRQVDDLVAGGKADKLKDAISEAEELLDFDAIILQHADGKTAEARRAFAARSRWMTPSAPAVALVTERLRQGASPAELTGALARDPAGLRAEGLKARLATAVGEKKKTTELFRAVNHLQKGGEFNPLVRATWKAEKSPYLFKRTAKTKYKGELVAILTPGLSYRATGKALLLHTALLAQQRGAGGFVISPARDKIYAINVLFGDPGDPGMPEAAFLNAGDVIAALSTDLPEPVPTR